MTLLHGRVGVYAGVESSSGGRKIGMASLVRNSLKSSPFPRLGCSPCELLRCAVVYPDVNVVLGHRVSTQTRT